MLAMAGDETQHQAHDEHHGIQTVCGVQRRQRTAVRHNRTVTTKVSMVPMVPQVRTKLTSFGEATLVCREPRVMSEV